MIDRVFSRQAMNCGAKQSVIYLKCSQSVKAGQVIACGALCPVGWGTDDEQLPGDFPEITQWQYGARGVGPRGAVIPDD